MARYKIKGDKGVLTLRKSRKFVGLQLSEQAEAGAEQAFIEEEVRDRLGGFRVVRLKQDGNRLDDQLDKVRARDEVKLGTHVFYAEGSDKPLVPTGEITITFAEGSSSEEQQIVLEEFALQLVERRSPVMVIVQVTRQSPNPVRAAAEMQASSLVELAEPDMDSVLDSYSWMPAEPLIDQQWCLQNRGFLPNTQARLQAGADARVIKAWKRLGHTGTDEIILAVIDNGFDLSHPDLQRKIIHPFDFRRQSSSIEQGNPRYIHGTPCATLALADGNGQGMVGVAPKARFMPLEGTSFSDRVTEQQFDYCIRRGAAIISCSWGTIDPTQRLSYRKEQAIARAAREGRNGKGCIIIFAAGNENQQNLINYYAQHPDVIAVAASTSLDQHASYSNQGSGLTVCAPSSGAFPLLAGRAWWDQGFSNQQGAHRYWIDGITRGSHYKHFGGTSGATPIAAGVCALILSANPQLTAREVRNILIQTADKIGGAHAYDHQGYSRRYGYGRINAEKAIAMALRQKETYVPSQPEPTTDTSGGLFEVSVNDSVQMGWGVQVGAYTNYDQVMVLVNQLERTYQQPVHVQSVQSGGRSVYRVIVGSFARQSETQELQRRLRADGFSGAFAKNLREV